MTVSQSINSQNIMNFDSEEEEGSTRLMKAIPFGERHRNGLKKDEDLIFNEIVSGRANTFYDEHAQRFRTRQPTWVKMPLLKYKPKPVDPIKSIHFLKN